VTYFRRYGDHYDRERGAQQVGELVQRVVDHHRLHLDIREERLFAEWSAFVGERVGGKTRPQTIVERTLIVEVANNSWLHELTMLRPKINADLLDKLGPPRFFDDIKFVLAKEGKRREVTRPAARSRPAPPARPPATPANGAALQQILDDTQGIADPELRALILNVRVANDK
jgi:hypothetical protein